MDWKEGLVVIAVFACGGVFLVESVLYIRRGVYTKTFKGTTRREYIKKDERRDVYWLYVILHLFAGSSAICLGFWLMQYDPKVNDWYVSIRNSLTF
ncbi:hypothetical protein HS962_00725 [Pantoea sp. BIGb0393]|uniref:Uncharacterized protein n=1 Tax=Pantoea nemavictus TaxID=2726955 RepID=A0ABU8PLZ2_9GAMM|nr:hypothetical protein [Pantoea nemavictus]MBA0034768.1 hypothetical protein [Pantoea nemavictus]